MVFNSKDVDYSEQENVEVKTTWNLSEWKINLIGQLIQKAAFNFKKNPVQALECWQQIFLVISNRITDKQKNHALKIEAEIFSDGTAPNLENEYKVGTEDHRLYARVLLPSFSYYVRTYIEYVNFLLREVGLDIKEKEPDDMF